MWNAILLALTFLVFGSPSPSQGDSTSRSEPGQRQPKDREPTNGPRVDSAHKTHRNDSQGK
jgi:hypothetical protein